MWCIGKLTKEYRERMYDLLDIYARPYQENEPVVCVDEKSKQLLEQPRTPIPASPGKPIKEDYEYKRAGTRNIFMAIEPKGGRRQVEVTARRTKGDFVKFVSHLAKKVYVGAHKIHLVLDNLNTHFRSSFEEVLGIKRATQLLERVEFHYTPKHASWMNQVEIWLSILVRKVIKRGNFTSIQELKRKVLAFIEYYNRTMAKPFKWTYQGKALAA